MTTQRLRALRADSQLLLAALIWGLAFVAQRQATSIIEPFAFNAVRFAIGSLILLPLVITRRKLPGNHTAPAPAASGKQRRGLLFAGTIAGLVLFIAVSFQQIGIKHTTAGKAGFITGLYVVLVPILGLLWRQRPAWATWLGAALAAAGLYLLSVTDKFTIDAGDALVLASAVFYAGHVLVIGHLCTRHSTLRLAALQYAICAALSFAVTLCCENLQMQHLIDAAVPILYTGILSVGVAYTLQVVGQKLAPPAHAAIILSMESVFAAVFGGLILHEVLSGRSLTGCVLMLTGMLLSQLAPRRSQ